MQDKLSITITLLREIVISGVLLFVLSLVIDIFGVWLAIPITELIV